MEKAGESSYYTTHDTHGMCIELESFVKVQDLLMDKHLVTNSGVELCKSFLCWFVTIQEDETYFDESTFICEIFNVITSVIELSLGSGIADS